MALTKITSTNIGANAVTSSALSNTALTTALGYTPANKAGDIITGDTTINSSSTGMPLTIMSNATVSSEVNIVLTNGTSNKETIVNFGDSLTGGARHKGRIFYRGTDDSMRMWTNAGTSGWVVDSGGRMTLPSQPCFHAGKYDDAGQIASGVYVFNSVDLNTGSCYNNTNGRFTAPVAGNYYFIATQQLYGSSSGSADVRFYKNGSAYLANSPESYGQVPNSATHQTITHMAIIPLAAGDYVTVYRNMPTRGMQSHFCGWLIS